MGKKERKKVFLFYFLLQFSYLPSIFADNQRAYHSYIFRVDIYSRWWGFEDFASLLRWRAVVVMAATADHDVAKVMIAMKTKLFDAIILHSAMEYGVDMWGPG